MGSAAKGRESPVLDRPNVRGTLAVCSVSFGLLALGGEGPIVAGDRLHDILF